MTKVSIDVEDWALDGTRPSVGTVFSFRLFRPRHDEASGEIESTRTWTAKLDSEGHAETEIPPAELGNALRIESAASVLSAVYVASYPTTANLRLIDLVQDYAVDPHTLQPIDPPAAWWTALSQYVKTVNNVTPDSAGNVNTSGGGGGTAATVGTIPPDESTPGYLYIQKVTA